MAVAKLTLILLLALAPAVGATARAAGDALPGVIGRDDRRIVASQETPWSAIGKVNIAGYRRRSICTGTLVAPRIVITAAHCLFERSTGKIKPLHQIHFLVGARRSDNLGHGRAECLRFLDGAGGHAALRRRGDPARDVAAIVLREPLLVPPAPIAPRPPAGIGAVLDHASYPRDRRHMLSAHSGCRLTAKTGALWLTDCDTNFGSSGGPVFVRRGGRLMLAAIMVGALKRRATIAVPVSLWRDLLTARCRPER